MMERIASVLRSGREARGWNVQQASLYTGVSAAHISRIENGKREASPHILRKLADGYGMDYEELMSIAGYLDGTVDSVNPKPRPSTTQEIAELLERLPKERQEWYRDLVLFDLQKTGFDDAMIELAATRERSLVTAVV